MNELKPVVIFKGVRHNSRTEIWGFLSSPDIVPQANTDLYQIPDTHRVVSVEYLEELEHQLKEAKGMMKFTKLTDTAITPSRGTPGSAGLDLHADQDMLVHSGAAVMVGTGIAIEIPDGHVGLVCIRSSVGKAGVALANSVGVIDADYRGEIKLCLTYTAGSGGHYIRKGNAVAQLLVVPIVMAELVEVDGLTTTDRGAGGFGSTGK